MKYIFTQEGCTACDLKREAFKLQGLLFEERDSERLKHPSDDVDIEGVAVLAFQQGKFPVEVNRNGEN